MHMDITPLTYRSRAAGTCVITQFLRETSTVSAFYKGYSKRCS